MPVGRWLADRKESYLIFISVTSVSRFVNSGKVCEMRSLKRPPIWPTENKIIDTLMKTIWINWQQNPTLRISGNRLILIITVDFEVQFWVARYRGETVRLVPMPHLSVARRLSWCWYGHIVGRRKTLNGRSDQLKWHAKSSPKCHIPTYPDGASETLNKHLNIL